ncbi:MAG: hypothetical protein P8O84_07575 [Synechococcus sp. cluster3_bin.96]|nr:hypothetical protein [Synechococcus sp. cluster3_bin.96]
MHRSAGKGNGFELTREAREQQPSLKVVVLALGDAIPVEYANATWLEAIVAEARSLRASLLPECLSSLRSFSPSELSQTHAGRI